ncbi:restriction endonuclease subunit S [Streptomyces goshikiensis]|uniref:restriction endonuclease subunit S n=1 Tax=Streptomyces goshikiensis TaxID=1942 RepID=UPI0036CBD1AF
MYERIKDVDHPDEQMLSVFRSYGVVAKDSYQNINQTAENRSIYQLVHPGWLVTNRMKAWQGSVGISLLRGIVSGHYVCFAPRHEEDHGYLNWLFRSPPYIAGYGMISRGVRPGQAEIDNDQYRLLPVVVPPLAEQKAIAAYLDRETKKIDTLITEQQRLVEMLRERRDAIVETCIQGAESVQLKYLLLATRPLTYGIIQAGEPVDDGVPYIGPSDIINHEGVAAPETLRKTTYEIALAYQRSALIEGDLIVSIGPAFGKTMIVPAELTGANLTQDTARVACNDRIAFNQYVQWVLQSLGVFRFWDQQITGATFRRLNLDTLARTPIPLPPLDEQRRIVRRLDRETAQIDTLIAESERLIELSQERRSALVTAVVTGQIDVRGEAA